MGVGYVIVMSGSGYAWTIVGVALAIGLTAAGVRGGDRVKRRADVASSEPDRVELDDLLQHRARIGAAVLLARHRPTVFQPAQRSARGDGWQPRCPDAQAPRCRVGSQES